MINSKINNKNILITGVTGFIGGNLIKKLYDKGGNIFGLIRNNNPNSFLSIEGYDKKIRLINGDLSNVEFLYNIITENQIQFIYHLAAQVEIGVGLTNPHLTFETNVRGTYNLLEACRRSVGSKHILKSIIIASSDKAYGEYPPEKMPYEEDYPLIPKYPYDTSKACADMIAKSYSIDEYNLPIVITRFSNIYGPGQMNFSAIIPDSIICAFGKKKFIPRSDGTMVRDFLFSEDVADLYIKISIHLSSKPNKIKGQVFNAGSNNPIKIKSLVSKIFNLIDNKIELDKIIKEMNGKKTIGEIHYQHMSYEKVSAFFGWTPKHKLDEGLKKTINWYKKII